APTEVIRDCPFGSTAIPRSSVTPEVIRSGRPSGNCCRQRWESPSTAAAKYIHPPSGDHAAAVHPAPAGPTGFPIVDPSKGRSLHGSQPLVSISTASIHCPLGASSEKCAIPSVDRGR